jgi:hypothetical protein
MEPEKPLKGIAWLPGDPGSGGIRTITPDRDGVG